MPDNSAKEEKIRLYFRISLFLKGAFSALEIVSGLLVFFIPVAAVTTMVTEFAQAELLEDPNDFVATHAMSLAHEFSLVGGTFIALYLLSRGLIKLVLIVALLKNQLWAYPSSLVVLGLFVAYQFYQIAISFSIFLIVLTIFDLIVMWFIWQEYKIIKEGHSTQPLAL